ncbi:DUF4230 domain-containing protein [Pseudarthrobacter oxydans]|uniref:DUF4230 domain-containing protein n=1 Tax=Pseudarthrobacter oxydans TaxID=1671 RepID=UPI0037FC2E07
MPIIAKLLKGAALLVVGAFVALTLSGFGFMNMFASNPFQVNQVDRRQPVLLKSIHEISQFHSAVGNFEVVIDIEEDVDWMPGFIAGRRTLFVAAGTVNAYVDLSGLADEDLELSPDGKTVTVRLPEPKLDKPNLDFDRSYIYGQDRGLFDRIADAIETPQQEKFFQDAETKMAAAAEESELRKQAADNTKTMLTGMFGGMGIKTTFL